MNKKVVIPVVLIGTGIGLYFLNKAGKLDKLKALFNKKNDELITPIEPPILPPPSGQPTNIIIANPFTSAQLLAFQKWVNLTYKPTIPLVEDGIWGTNSAAAYNSYGTAYANVGKTEPENTKTDYEKLLKKIGQGVATTRFYNPNYTRVAYDAGWNRNELNFKFYENSIPNELPDVNFIVYDTVRAKKIGVGKWFSNGDITLFEKNIKNNKLVVDKNSFFKPQQGNVWNNLKLIEKLLY